MTCQIRYVRVRYLHIRLAALHIRLAAYWLSPKLTPSEGQA